MKIILVGPGIIQIPPHGWGAVELLIWDHYTILKELGHDVYIINTANHAEIIQKVNELNAELVHFHYDEHWILLSQIIARTILITSHYPYITDNTKWKLDKYDKIVNGLCKIAKLSNVFIGCLNMSCVATFNNYGISHDKMFLFENSIREDTIPFYEIPEYPCKVICVGKIEDRKRQYLTTTLDNVFYIGKGYMNHKNFLGEWNHTTICENISKYDAFLLLSTEENDSLALKEALIAGLPCIVSEGVVKNIGRLAGLNAAIRILNEDECNYPQHIEHVILEHIESMKSERKYIRDTSIKMFAMKRHIAKYIETIKKIAPLKIMFISTGVGSWPNDGWGACENLTFELSNALNNQNVETNIYHQPNNHSLKQAIIRFKPDIIHCEYDNHISWLFQLKQEFPNIQFRFTTHYAYLTNEQHVFSSGYKQYFYDAVEATKQGIVLYCLSENIQNMYLKYGADSNNIKLFHNGANSSIQFHETGSINKALCLAKIEYRKGQQYLSNIQDVDIIGPIHDKDIKILSYIGHWNRNDIKDKLTTYKSLILLSNGEAHPLCICEALMAGLSIVISNTASSNLDLSKPWIYIIDDSKFNDISYLQNIITKSIEENYLFRNEIREYALKTFSWDILAKRYLE